jgi:hypothetical protein
MDEFTMGFNDGRAGLCPLFVLAVRKSEYMRGWSLGDAERMARQRAKWSEQQRLQEKRNES